MWHRTEFRDLVIWQSGHQSVIKACGRRDQTPLSAITLFASSEFFLKLHITYRTVIDTADVGLAAIGQ
jgi:hypothetical protein